MLFGYYPAYTMVPGYNEIRIGMDIGYFRIKLLDIVLVGWTSLYLIEFLRQVSEIKRIQN